MKPVLELEAPIMVDFEITDRCPYRCFFCEGDIPNIDPIPKLLSTAECFHILEKLSSGGVFGVFFTGGEPLLRSDLPDIIKFCLHVGLEPSVSTNAFYLDEIQLSKLFDVGLKGLQVSIHGPGSIHDFIVGKPGAYSKVMKHLEKIVKIGFDVEVACVCLKENIRYIPMLIREIASIGIRYFRILRYVPGYRKEMLKHIPSKRLVEEIIPQIKDVANEYGVDCLLSFCPGLSMSQIPVLEGIHPVTFTCPAGKVEFTILPNGDVYPCTFFRYKPEMYAGNILKDDVSKLWNHPKMVELRRLTPNDYTGICGQCERKWVCYSARCVAYNLTNNIYGDDLSCYLVREKVVPEDSLMNNLNRAQGYDQDVK